MGLVLAVLPPTSSPTTYRIWFHTSHSYDVGSYRYTRLRLYNQLVYYDAERCMLSGLVCGLVRPLPVTFCYTPLDSVPASCGSRYLHTPRWARTPFCLLQLRFTVLVISLFRFYAHTDG